MSSRNRHQQISPPTKEGSLIKYRNFWAGWSLRYFKLDKCYLHYFETKYAPEPIDSIPRNCIIGAKVSNEFTDKQFVIEILQKSGTIWYAQASSMEEMIEWIRVLSPVPQFINPDMYPTTPIVDMSQSQTSSQNHGSITSSMLYPNLSHSASYSYSGHTHGPNDFNPPPPPYSEIINQHER